MSEILNYTLPEHLRARQEAQRSERVVQVVALCLAAACLVGAALLIQPINRLRKENQLIIDPKDIAGLPPDIALANKLGTFRALAIDWASIRADRLKEQGKMYEALELHQLVCKLQPRFPTAWVNAAWNMAYNISVTQYSPEARWKWVSNGIKLLRDEGLKYNPRSVTLYKELAWIYWHKMGDFLDDEHRAYRRALAVEIEAVLGPPPVTVTDEEYFAWFKKIADAPTDFDQFVRDDPEAAQIMRRIEAENLTLEDFLRLVAVARRTAIQPSALVREDASSAPTRQQPNVAEAILQQPGIDRFLAAARSRVLRESRGLRPDWMYSTMMRYGPLDWRSTFVHSLYWSHVGNERTRGQMNLNPADSMNTARLVLNSLQGLVARGRIVAAPDFQDPFRSYVEETTDSRFIPKLREAYERLSEEQWGDTEGWKAAGIMGTSYKTGFVSKMQEWIQMLYFEGGERNLELAQEYYVWLRYNNPEPDGSPQPQYMGSVEAFVEGTVLNQLQTYKAAGGIINSFLVMSLKQLALGQTEQSVRSAQRAKKCWDIWMEPARNDYNDRRQMPPFVIMYRDAMIAFIQSPNINALEKSRLWHQLDAEYQRYAYDYLVPYFEHLCDGMDPKWDASKAFPEPPGMEDFRKRKIEAPGDSRDEGVDQGTRYKE